MRSSYFNAAGNGRLKSGNDTGKKWITGAGCADQAETFAGNDGEVDAMWNPVNAR